MPKPIEPGCRAMLVNCIAPENNGKIVTVGMFMGDIHGFLEGSHWEVDSAVVSVDLIDGSRSYHYHVSESKLQRIDDYDGDQAGSWEEIKDIWCPDEITVNN